MARFEQTEAASTGSNRQASLNVSLEEMQAFRGSQNTRASDSNYGLTPHQAVDSLYIPNHVNDSNLSSMTAGCDQGPAVARQYLSHQEQQWRPNANDNSQQAMEWRKEREAQANAGLNLDGHANYTVQRGDTLSDIAKRSLIGRGAEEVTGKDVEREMLRIMQENKDRYPDLAKNRDLIKPGMKLYVGDECKAGSLPSPGASSEFPKYSYDGNAPKSGETFETAPQSGQTFETPPAPSEKVRSAPGALGQSKEEVAPSERKNSEPKETTPWQMLQQYSFDIMPD